MRKKIITLLSLILLGNATPVISATNDLPSDIDTNGQLINAHSGGVIYYSGNYYWYGEYRDSKPNDGKHWDSNQKVTLYKSKDMRNWEYIGIILDLSKDPRNWDLERPKIIYNKKYKNFVMWFHLEPDRKFTEGYAGVAISKSITGPFHLVNVERPNKNIMPINGSESQNNNWFIKQANKKFTQFLPNGQQVRDLTTFVDDDGTAYLIYESEDDYSLQVVKLSSDYQSFTKTYSRILVGKQNEAPTITKYDGKYFLISSGLTGYKPNPPRIAVAQSIFGPWKELGSPIYNNQEQISETIFNAQPSYIFKDPKSKNIFLIMDRWDTSEGGFKNLWKSTYAWVPLKYSDNTFKIFN